MDRWYAPVPSYQWKFCWVDRWHAPHLPPVTTPPPPLYSPIWPQIWTLFPQTFTTWPAFGLHSGLPPRKSLIFQWYWRELPGNPCLRFGSEAQVYSFNLHGCIKGNLVFNFLYIGCCLWIYRRWVCLPTSVCNLVIIRPVHYLSPHPTDLTLLVTSGRYVYTTVNWCGLLIITVSISETEGVGGGHREGVVQVWGDNGDPLAIDHR